jgi:hypothetical protein
MTFEQATAAPARSFPRTHGLPRLQLANGSLEALKWLALLLMLGDHVNKYLLHDSVPALFDAGRVVMPIFAIVLAYNLARPGTLASGVYPRVLTRLTVTAAVASVPFIALGGLGWGWWPLNVMAALSLVTAGLRLFDLGGTARVASGVALLIVGGLLVEFWWAILAIAVAAWLYARRPRWSALGLAALGFAGLHLVNRNEWALAALPLIALAGLVDLRVPRARWAFYAFYPLHLAAIWAVRTTAMG